MGLPLMLLAAAALLGSGCRGKEADAAPAAFRLSDTLASMIRVDTVRTEAVAGELRLGGKITFDQDEVVKVFLPIGGIVSQVKVELGDRVEKGQVLAVVKSGEVAGYEQERISANANLEIARKNLDAVQDMHASGVSSQKELITAQKEFAKAEAESLRVAKIFEIYGIGKEADYLIRAPRAGFVVDRKIAAGTQMRPDNSDNVFTIGDLGKVWVIANIYETDIAKVAPGYAAEITTLTYPDKKFQGKVDKVFNVLDPDSHVMKVRIALDNPGYLLKPEMFASTVIRYTEKRALPEIPSQAVIFDKSKNFVLVYRDRSDIEPREVDLDRTVSDRAFVKSGLKDGERIVSRYHLLIYDELTGG